jgi:hypothetical protein
MGGEEVFGEDVPAARARNGLQDLPLVQGKAVPGGAGMRCLPDYAVRRYAEMRNALSRTIPFRSPASSPSCRLKGGIRACGGPAPASSSTTTALQAEKGGQSSRKIPLDPPLRW